MTNEEQALAFASDKGRLFKRLRQAKTCLLPAYKTFFCTYRFDFERKCLLGTEGYRLQWQTRDEPNEPEDYDNQQTNRGMVAVYRDMTVDGFIDELVKWTEEIKGEHPQRILQDELPNEG